jgi:hypothetical protein
MNIRLVSVLVLTVVIYAVNILAYAARLAGIRTQRPAQARSLYNLLALSSRAAYAVQATLLAGLVDLSAMGTLVTDLSSTLRFVLLAAAAGILVGAALVPSASSLLVRGVQSYQARGSIPRVVLHGVSIEGLPRAWRLLRRPHTHSVLYAREHRPRKRWILITVVVAAVSAVAGPAAQIASVVASEGTRTSLSLSSFLTGLGLVLMTLFVDPVTAQVTDQALRGERPAQDVTVFSVWQIGAQLVGVLSAQLLLVPVARMLAAITGMLVG